MAMVKFYKDGDSMALLTDALDEDAFWEAFSDGLATMIDDRRYEHDWPFQLEAWLPQAFDIVATMRGHKVDNVVEQRILIAGASRCPNTEHVVQTGESQAQKARHMKFTPHTPTPTPTTWP